MTAPCKNCPYRAIGCHSICGPYMKYREKQQQINERRIKVQKADEAIIEGNRRRAVKPKRK